MFLYCFLQIMRLLRAVSSSRWHVCLLSFWKSLFLTWYCLSSLICIPHKCVYTCLNVYYIFSNWHTFHSINYQHLLYKFQILVYILSANYFVSVVSFVTLWNFVAQLLFSNEYISNYVTVQTSERALQEEELISVLALKNTNQQSALS